MLRNLHTFQHNALPAQPQRVNEMIPAPTECVLINNGLYCVVPNDDRALRFHAL